VVVVDGIMQTQGLLEDLVVAVAWAKAVVAQVALQLQDKEMLVELVEQISAAGLAQEAVAEGVQERLDIVGLLH
jgi:hypothetical protein